jgi:predicted naringenin-chalcone synthase
MNTDQTLEMEGILPNLLFGDGAASVLVTIRQKEGLWKINEPLCALMGEDTSSCIDMHTRENGYYLNLSKDLVPRLHRNLSEKWTDILRILTKTSDPEELEWVIHPGGKAILDSFTKQNPPLSQHALRLSWKIMKEKGNLVSATLIFVLELMLSKPEKDQACLVGPGPGLEWKFLSLERTF